LDSEISSQSGAAYIFANLGGAWQQQVKLVGEDTEALDRFATSVAISGTDAFIGQMYDDDRAMNSGAVYSFRRIDGNWIQNKKIIPGAGKKIVVEADFKNLEFGSAIAVSQDLVVVSGHFNGHAKGTGTAAYIFDREKDFDAPYPAKRSGLVVRTLARIKATSLLQNIPNPFNPETWIPFYLGTDGEVNVSIYNIRGLLVRHLDLGRKTAGIYLTKESSAHWDGRNQHGESVPSGIYFYSLNTGTHHATGRMVLLK
jgi:hypothetical protein